MSQQENDTQPVKHHPRLKALKVAAWVVGSVIVLAVIGIWCIMLYFSPARIAGMIEEKSPEFR